MKSKWVCILAMLMVGAILLGLCTCCGLKKVGHGMKQALEAPLEDDESAGSGGGNYFFEPDPDWLKRHPEYEGEYGIVHYHDYNGDGKCQGGEVIRVIPKGYPYSIDFSKDPYSPGGKDRVVRKIDEAEQKEENEGGEDQ